MLEEKKKKKNEFEVYHLKENNKFLKLTEKTEYTREDKTRLVHKIEIVIRYNGKVDMFINHTDFNENGTVNFEDHKKVDSFLLPTDELEKLKKFARKKLILKELEYFKRNNDICYTKCIIQWYTGFKNTPIKKVVNDYEISYPYILSVLKPYTKIDRLHLSNLSVVRNNIVNGI